LIAEEGFRQHPYHDTQGVLTVGYGRNLEAVGISREEAAFMLDRDIERVDAQLSVAFGWFQVQPEEVQRALANMVYQLGFGGLLKFHNMLTHLLNGDRKAAAREALDSLWAKQTPARAQRVAKLIEGD
jgi:lysozyme